MGKDWGDIKVFAKINLGWVCEENNIYFETVYILSNLSKIIVSGGCMNGVFSVFILYVLLILSSCRHLHTFGTNLKMTRRPVGE